MGKITAVAKTASKNRFAVLVESSEQDEEEEAKKVTKIVTQHKDGEILDGGWFVDSGVDIHVVPTWMFRGEVTPCRETGV